jgi:CRISPR-associated endonuclease/helicase Cas3
MQSNDFDVFFEALHGYAPFPWQSRLARQLCEQGRWPAALNLPTSSGKTAALDAALFHLIVEAAKPADQRRAPRRIFFVVDRRLIVDEAYERSVRVAERLYLHREQEGHLGIAARRLLDMAGEYAEQPLKVIRLRGGMPLERAFLSSPLQPAIILTTVDQLGSRLLFRGYGVSQNMRPIHAALTAIDSLILLDEAHLSRPFLQTLAAIDRYRSKAWWEKSLPLPQAVVQMTATPNDAKETFQLQDDDYRHPLLDQRLTCAKPAELKEVKLADDQHALIKALADSAFDLLDALPKQGEHPVVGIVANRVATARGVFESLRKRPGVADSILLTGRVRPADRDSLLETYLPRMKSGRAGDVNHKPLFVVATQTIEVGADLDFDGLMTEAASLDALRQRFGRLNRLGRRPHCRAEVIFVKSGKEDPIYGEALTRTWKWLNDHSSKNKKSRQFDFGIQTLNALLETEDVSALNMRQADAPVLLPAHLDALVQTSPPPRLSPDTALLLHGPNSQEEDVQVVWRADLPEIDIPNEAVITAMLQTLPPAQHETMAIPLYALQAYLLRRADTDLTDVEGSVFVEENARYTGGGKMVFVWKGKDKGQIIQAEQIKPGDVVVLRADAKYACADEYGWFPSSHTVVKDIAEYQCEKRRGKHYLRLHPNLVGDWFDPVQSNTVERLRQLIRQWPSRIEEGEKPSDLYDEILELARNESALRREVRAAVDVLSTGKRSEIAYPNLDNIEGVVLIARQNVPQTLVDDDDSTSMTREITLEKHSAGVAKMARHFAERCGFSSALLNVIEQAGGFHDLGKADPRFQALLQGGRRTHQRLLAKSGMNASDRRARQRAQTLSSYPQGQRHECYSVALLRQYPQILATIDDPELALYLIGSHHGRGRPFMPVIEDRGTEMDFVFNKQPLKFIGTHGLEKLDSGWVEMFWKLVRRYGYWGLAFLEAIVRLADQQRSEWETKHEDDE